MCVHKSSFKSVLNSAGKMHDFKSVKIIRSLSNWNMKWICFAGVWVHAKMMKSWGIQKEGSKRASQGGSVIYSECTSDTSCGDIPGTSNWKETLRQILKILLGLCILPRHENDSGFSSRSWRTWLKRGTPGIRLGTFAAVATWTCRKLRKIDR